MPTPDPSVTATPDPTTPPASATPVPAAGPIESPAPPASQTGTAIEPDEAGLFTTVLTAVGNQVRTTVKPAAVAAVATTFTFPLALAFLVLAYLLVQARLDSRDPKLRFAPTSAGETYVAFEEEDR